MGDIAQRGNRLTFAKGGKGEWIEPIKTKAKKDTESVRDVRAGGGRAGFFGGARVIKGAIKLLKEHATKKGWKSIE